MTTLEYLPIDVYNHFNLTLSDLVNLTKTNTYIHNLIMKSNIKINEFITYKKYMKQWIKFLLSIKINNENLNDINLFSNVRSLDFSNTRVVDVSCLGRVHTLNISHTNVVDVSTLGRVHTLDLSGTKVVNVSVLERVNSLIK